MRFPASISHGFSSMLHSRFEAVLYPLEKEEDVPALLASFKKEYPKADHYPYGYRLGSKSKSSDDGEPGGSAGRPFLELLEKKEVDRALLICARYFGGTKLGVGNLRRCFVESAAQALEKGEYLCPQTMYRYSLKLDYPTFDLLQRQSRRSGFSLEDVVFHESVEAVLLSRAKLNKTWEEMGLGALPLPDPQCVQILQKEEPHHDRNQ